MKAIFATVLILIGTLFGCEQDLFTPDLTELLTVMEISHDGTPSSIVQATQKSWIRPAGKERWHLQDTLTSLQKKAVMVYCQKMGFLNEIRPALKEYDYAVIFGATVSRMEKRIAFLDKVANSGVHFKKVILLSGARPLDPSVETIPEGCKTEGDAMAYLWKKHLLSQKVTWEQFDHPMIDATKRPNTGDTIKRWLASSPATGTCCMISDQPYCLYQQLVTQNLMPKEFKCETIGSAPDLDALNSQAALDTIARCLYESNKFIQKGAA